MSEALDFLQPLDNDSEKWKVIERSLELATQAESLREYSRKLRETSRQIREESDRITREKILAQI
jgi:hypothetical protein